MNNIAIPVFLLHNTGKYVLKDFKPENILVTHSGEITIVDMDSIQITSGRQILFPGTAATQDYVPPEFYNENVGKTISIPLKKSWDNFALSVVFYKLLLGLHPYAVTPKNQDDDSSCDISNNISNDLFPFGTNACNISGFPPPHEKFNILPESLQNFFKRAFSLNASERPNADEWGKLLHDIIRNAETLKPFTPPIKRKKAVSASSDEEKGKDITVKKPENFKTLAVWSILIGVCSILIDLYLIITSQSWGTWYFIIYDGTMFWRTLGIILGSIAVIRSNTVDAAWRDNRINDAIKFSKKNKKIAVAAIILTAFHFIYFFMILLENWL
jgi:serine/threonine protein kinase